MQKGTINVQTENIFPIIKKFLYSDHDIFLRELVSNAVDATQKLKALSSIGQVEGDLGDVTIEIEIDKENKTLTIHDKGIGMTAEEVDKYINQIAFSSAEEFLEKFKGVDSASIIGHFGLGFYSSFMVASKVQIISKSYKVDSQAVIWECDGSPNYTLNEIEKTSRGTDIILHISDDALEFLEEHKILELLKKYCKFLPVPIRFGNEKKWETQKDESLEVVEGEEKKEPKRIEVEYPRIINNTNPLWKKAPSDITEDEYKSFYHELYPNTFEEPLFSIHLNVDYPFNLTGILYFPKARKTMEVQKEKIHLYCNQVFITDQLEGIVPDFLTLLHGVIDSPDIPLNVSRSYLQSDGNVKKISSHISKKVADKLEEMFKQNREDFEKKWDDIKIFIQYGMITDEKFYERAAKFFLFKNVDGKYFTFDEYKNHIETLQKDKHDSLIYLYASDEKIQYTYIQSIKERGYDVLIMDGMLDSHFINTIESKFEKSRFNRVDADVVDKLIEKDEPQPSKLNEEEQKDLVSLFEAQVEKARFSVVTENLSETDLPVMITRSEFMRRWSDMQALNGGSKTFMPGLDSYNIVVNSNHPLMGKVIAEQEQDQKDMLVKQLIDLAMLSQNILEGEALNDFIKRSVSMIGK
ncbi:MAG: molecular chaperone HtpG [Bacteroidota bacterium]